jgi:hypothetical protein
VLAVGRASSADVLAWLWGRPMTTLLTIDGDADLLDEWNLFQRSPLRSIPPVNACAPDRRFGTQRGVASSLASIEHDQSSEV